MTYSDYRKMKRRRRIKNTHTYKERVKSLAKNSNFYPSPAYAKFKNNTDEIIYYRRAYASDFGDTRFIKKETNKKVRNINNEFRKKSCDYKRAYEYWWNLT